MRRKRTLALLLWQTKSGLKRLAWRLSAAWCWLHAIVSLFGGRTFLHKLDAAFVETIISVLSKSGFTPSNATRLPFLLEVLWVLLITAFSWIQIFGLALYVILWPAVMLFIYRHRLAMKEARIQSAKIAQSLRSNRPVWTYALITCLIVWFILYGTSHVRTPVVVAVIITGLLFAVRLMRAFEYATLEYRTGASLIERYIESVIKQFERLGNKLREQKPLTVRALTTNLQPLKFWHWTFRLICRWLYGRAARNRAALMALLQYIFNFCVLGGLAILFWGLIIHYSTLSDLRAAILASASRVIPGVPEPNLVTIPDWVKTAASVTAWIIFVIYAGPVASLFPMVQERFVKRTYRRYAQVRMARKRLYLPLSQFKVAIKIAQDNPELEPILDFVLMFKMHPDLNQLFKDGPEVARVLDENPVLIQLLTSNGIVLPDLKQFIIPRSDEVVSEQIVDVPLPASMSPERRSFHETTAIEGLDGEENKIPE
jgi:hypothetical protein